MAENPSQSQSWFSLLAQSGCRVTAPRRAIVETILSSSKALSPIEIFDISRRHYPQLGLVTVYRTLEKLEELGLISHVHEGEGCHMVLRAAQGHEHLLICSGCGKSEYFSGDDLSSLENQVRNRTGYTIDDHWLQFSGLCPACQKQF